MQAYANAAMVIDGNDVLQKEKRRVNISGLLIFTVIDWQSAVSEGKIP